MLVDELMEAAARPACNQGVVMLLRHAFGILIFVLSNIDIFLSITITVSP
jgi:hypothetical protein